MSASDALPALERRANREDYPLEPQTIDFLIIGATKSATTWLQHALTADPAIYMPGPELHFFSREYDNGIPWYLQQFDVPGDALKIGEKSNTYLENPAAAERIARFQPDVSLIAQLRNPIDRAYSDYCMMYRRGEVTRHIADYLDPRTPQNTRLLTSGCYHARLKNYYDQFDRERLLITFYESVQSAPDWLVTTVRQFLGLNAPLPPVELGGKVKDKTTPVLNSMLRRTLAPVKPLIAPWRKTALFRKLHQSLAREVQHPALPDDLRARLIAYYAPDVEALGRMTGHDLSHWLEPGPVGETRNHVRILTAGLGET